MSCRPTAHAIVECDASSILHLSLPAKITLCLQERRGTALRRDRDGKGSGCCTTQIVESLSVQGDGCGYPRVSTRARRVRGNGPVDRQIDQDLPVIVHEPVLGAVCKSALVPAPDRS